MMPRGKKDARPSWESLKPLVTTRLPGCTVYCLPTKSSTCVDASPRVRLQHAVGALLAGHRCGDGHRRVGDQGDVGGVVRDGRDAARPAPRRCSPSSQRRRRPGRRPGCRRRCPGRAAPSARTARASGRSRARCAACRSRAPGRPAELHVAELGLQLGRQLAVGLRRRRAACAGARSPARRRSRSWRARCTSSAQPPASRNGCATPLHDARRQARTRRRASAACHADRRCRPPGSRP